MHKGTAPGPPLTISVRKVLNRIKSNFVCMETYLNSNSTEISDKFYKLVITGKFDKDANEREEESALHFKLSDMTQKPMPFSI